MSEPTTPVQDETPSAVSEETAAPADDTTSDDEGDAEDGE